MNPIGWVLSVGAVLLFSLWLLDEATVPFWEQTECLQAQTTMYGVTVHGYGVWGWVRNDNTFPVRIRSTWVAAGERDRWIEVLKPGQRIVDHTDYQILYHVYRLDDSEEYGLVWATGNGPVGPHWRNPFTHIWRRHVLGQRFVPALS
jgi:hypothetical protein